MNWGFQNETIDVRTGNGIDDTLLEALHYTAKDGQIYRAPINSTTDGLSIPRIVQNILPATGKYWFSGVLHDSAYRGLLERWSNEKQDWFPASLSRQQSDNLMLEALESQAVSWLERQIIHKALRAFGWKAWNDNRKTKEQ